MINLKKN